MKHWHQGKLRRWLSRSGAALLTCMALGAGIGQAQTLRELPLGPAAPAPTQLIRDNKPTRDAAAKTAAAQAKAAPAAPVAPANVPAVNVAAAAPKAAPAAVQVASAPASAASAAKTAAKGKADDRTIHDPNVKKAQCCGGLLSAAAGSGGSCANGKCTPGRGQCAWCGTDTVWGRMIGAVYDCVCCPDSCYEPRFIAEANAAFFQDGARPVSQTRIRWDAGLNRNFPDTGEFFWAKAGGKGPAFETRVDVHELTLYQEIAAGGKFSFFTEMPYRQVGPELTPSHSGFGDVNLGTKSMFLDCELMQMTFMFRTYIPAGSPGKGLGTGHVSLEPSLLTTIKLTPKAYLQTQIAEWIPLGGDGAHMGAVLHYHVSVNRTLWRANEHAALIGTLEFNGYTWQDGDFTVAPDTVASASSHSYLHFGPGIRFCLCNRVDIGVGMGIGLGDHGPDQNYRTEFRVRY